MSNENNTKRQSAIEQLKLGFDFYGKGELDKAIKHWGNVQRDDDKKAYAGAQFCLGYYFNRKGDTDKYIKHWGNIQRDDDEEA